jgi:hypothetical protein
MVLLSTRQLSAIFRQLYEIVRSAYRLCGNVILLSRIPCCIKLGEAACNPALFAKITRVPSRAKLLKVQTHLWRSSLTTSLVLFTRLMYSDEMHV